MARFETKEQIFGLFFGAAGVAALLILLVTAEARSRDLSEPEPVAEARTTGFLDRIANLVMRSELSEEVVIEKRTRRKRSVDILAETSTDAAKSATQPQKEVQKVDKLDLSEKLLEEQASGHKVRHLGEKIRQLGADSELVKTVLKVFCSKEKYFRTQFVNCNQTNFYHPEAAIKEEEAVETGKEHHQPLLEEDVFQDIKPDRQTHNQDCGMSQDCSAHTWLVVALTSLFNAVVFCTLFSSYNLLKYCRNKRRPQEDKIWLCEDDDISTLRDEQIEPRVGKITIVA